MSHARSRPRNICKGGCRAKSCTCAQHINSCAVTLWSPGATCRRAIDNSKPTACPMCQLAIAVQLLEEVQTEHEQIRGDAEQLRTWYLELFDAFTILKEQYVRLQKERDSVEHQYQQLCDGWRLELEQKQAAFDHARACILSQRDVEVLRSTICEEAERPFRAECVKLRKDAAQARAQFVHLRREVEAEKSAASAKVIHLETAIEQLKTQNDAHIAHAQQLASCSRCSGLSPSHPENGCSWV
eukprot:jgi/Ulvmu1/4398/UM002_0123.1